MSDARIRMLLKSALDERRRKNARYSLRSFSQYLGIDSSSISQYLRNKRGLPANQISQIALRLGWHAKDLKAARQVNQKTNQINKIKLQEFYRMGDWQHDAILEYLKLPSVSPKVEDIANALGLSCKHVETVIQRLVSLGWLKERNDGAFEVLVGDTTNILDEDFSNQALKNYQIQLLQLSQEKLSNVPRAHRDHSSIVFRCSKEEIAHLKKELSRFRRKIMAWSERDPKSCSEVYALQSSLFPLTVHKKSKESK